MSRIGKNIKKARSEKGYTQEQLAQKLSVTRDVYKRQPGYREIAYFFGLRIKYEQLWKEEPIWTKM